MKIKKKKHLDTIYDHPLNQIVGMFGNRGSVKPPIKGTKEQYQWSNSKDKNYDVGTTENTNINVTGTQVVTPKKINKIVTDTSPSDMTTEEILHHIEKYQKKYPNDIKEFRRDLIGEQYNPVLANSNQNVQDDAEKQHSIKKLQSAIDFPLYKREEQEKNPYISGDYGDQGETLKNVIFRDANSAQYSQKFYPEEFSKMSRETQYASLLPQREDTARYLSALQLLKENGSPYITQNFWEEDKYRARTSKENIKNTSNFSPSKNRMYLEPYDESAFISELPHAQQLSEGWKENPSVNQQLNKNYTQELKVNPKLDYNEYYDNKYYDTPGSVEYDAHTIRQPKLKDRYRFLQDSFNNELPLMSFKPQGIVEEEAKRKNAPNQPYYKGKLGQVRSVINKGLDNVLGTNFYTNLAYKNGGLLKAQNGYQWSTQKQPQQQVVNTENVNVGVSNPGTSPMYKGNSVDNAMRTMSYIGDGLSFIPTPWTEAVGYGIGLIPTTYDVYNDLSNKNYKQAGLDALGYIPGFKIMKQARLAKEATNAATKFNTVINTVNTAVDVTKDIEKKSKEGKKIPQMEYFDKKTGKKLANGGSSNIKGVNENVTSILQERNPLLQQAEQPYNNYYDKYMQIPDSKYTDIPGVQEDGYNGESENLNNTEQYNTRESKSGRVFKYKSYKR